MNVVYLSPHFPPAFTQFCQGLANNGVNVLGIGDVPSEEFPESLWGYLTDYYKVQDLEDYEQVYRAVGHFIHRYGRIDAVASQNEHWLMHEAGIREDFNIPGIKRERMATLKRKSAMKAFFKKAGAHFAAGDLVKNPDNVRAFVKKHGFPIFVKPDVGVGAVASAKISDEEGLQRFFQYFPETPYFMEEYIDGQLITFDGLVDQDGKVVFFSSLFSKSGAFDLVAYNDDLSFYLVRDIPEDIIELGHKCVEVFDLKAQFFHMEFLRRHEDAKLFALEMNFRPPGGFTVDLMNYASDINVYQEWANLLTNNEFTARVERKYFAAHISRKYGKNYQVSHEEILHRFGAHIAEHLEVPPIFSAVMGNYAYIVRSPELTDIEEMIRVIQAKV